MIFKSKYPNLRIVNGNIQFANGQFTTNDKTQIDILKDCKDVEQVEGQEYAKNLPLISVIIPSRVGEELKTISSLENQSYKNLEIIIEYDYYQEGVSVVRNRGLKKAQGEYIFFCDNDIDLKSDALMNLYLTLKKTKKDWAFGKFICDGIEWNKNKGKLPKNKKERVEYFEGVSTMSLVRASAKPKFDEKMKRFNDWDLWITLVSKKKYPAFCDEILFETKSRPQGISCQVDAGFWKNKLYEKHKVKKKEQKIADIIIPHHDQHRLLADCLSNISNKLFNIIIVSGGSFSENCNRGAKLAQTNNLIFLNDDTIPSNSALEAMVNNKADIVGISQKIPSMNNQLFSGLLTEIKNGKVTTKLCQQDKKPSYPSGFCFLFRKNVWQKLNGLSEDYINGGEDKDIFLRAIEAGYKFGYVSTPIVHLLSQSTGRFDNAMESEILFEKRFPAKRVDKLLNKTK